MTTHPKPVRNLTIAYGLILAANIGGALLVLPIFLQLLINSCACVYIGCLLSTRLAKNEKGAVVNYSKVLGEDEQVISMSDAKQFPLYASAFLFGFYVLYKYLPKEVFTTIINVYFSITTVLSTSGIFADVFPFSESQSKVFYSIQLPKWLQKVLEIKNFDLSVARIICIIAAALPVGFYFVTRHWALNNIFAILFSLTALKSLSLSSTKTGLFLLWALFFYDIFWVYGTDVMVTVAKNLDIPIKIVFPYLNAEGDFKTSMVGLGDLVIPGIFVSLCLKFDFDQSFAKNKEIKSFSQIELNYFNLVFVGYIYGIIETFLAMFIFEHPQPALLFLVPMCTIPVLIRAWFRGELNKFLEYDTALITQDKSEEGAKAEVKKD
jgi:minor histocompatibility antigen H13